MVKKISGETLHMARSKKNQRNQSKIIQQNISVSENFDYDKFAEAMVKAQLKVKDIEDGKKREKEEKEKQDLREAIGYIVYTDEPQNSIIKWWREVKNVFALIGHILSFKKKNAISDIATRVFLEIILDGALGIFKWCFYILSGLFVFTLFNSSIEKNIISIVFLLISTFFSFFIARVIRISQFEIENIKETEYLNAIFSSIIAFTAMIISIFTLGETIYLNVK